MQNAHSFRRSLLLSVSAVALVLLFAACPKVRMPPRIPGKSVQSKVDVKVHVSPAANNNNPVAVDLVLVSDKKLLQELMKLSASEWFEKRNQFALDYPKELGLGAARWEWVPGQQVKLDRLTFKYEATGGVVFANYFNAGAHRALIDPRKGILITLGEEDLCVQTLKEPAKPCPPTKGTR